MSCWRVWFDDSAVLVNADTAVEAQREAMRVTDRTWLLGRDPDTWGITRTEYLD